MAVRIKDGMIPYTGGIGIEITNNHVINVLLRKLNNLIHVNENRELYVDLQLDDWIQPDDDFPVGVTTGRILQEDWWPQSGLILNRKTTSWDYSRLITATDWNLYVDLGDWVWQLLWGGGWWVIADINTKTFYLPQNVTSGDDLTEAQNAIDWYFDDKDPILNWDGSLYVFAYEVINWADDSFICFVDPTLSTTLWENSGIMEFWQDKLRVYFNPDTNEVSGVVSVPHTFNPSGHGVLPTWGNPTTAFMPTEDYQPASKKYVDTEVAKKQDILTPWTRITIQTDPNTGDLVISADVSGVMTYMWNVTDASQLPTTGQNQWDCWYSELEKTLYAWDGTQWNDIGGTGIDLTNYFNMQVNDSDDITEGSTHLFVTQTEKNTWNGKQNPIRAWQNITIDSDGVTINAIDTKYTAWDGININVNNVISNTAKFDPSNAGSMWQFLKKTNDGYQWADIPWWGWWTSYTAWDWININNSNVISNTKPFDPSNTGTVGQVLKRNSSWYHWADESGWGWGGGWNFEPDNIWSEWQVLTREWWGYRWMNIKLPSGENNVKFWTINSNTINTDSALQKEIFDWVSQNANNWAILNDTYTNDVFIYNHLTTVWQYQSAVFFGKKRISHKVTQSWQTWWDYTVAYENRLTIATNGSTYNTIVDENPDDSTHTNYISAMTQGIYTKAFRPTEDYQPATKKYVDSVATGSVSLPVITQNSTGTTYTVSQEWVGTQAQYNQITPVNWVIYNIIPSS